MKYIIKESQFSLISEGNIKTFQKMIDFAVQTLKSNCENDQNLYGIFQMDLCRLLKYDTSVILTKIKQRYFKDSEDFYYVFFADINVKSLTHPIEDLKFLTSEISNILEKMFGVIVIIYGNLNFEKN
jgi:hypothetical protein